MLHNRLEEHSGSLEYVDEKGNNSEINGLKSVTIKGTEDILINSTIIGSNHNISIVESLEDFYNNSSIINDKNGEKEYVFPIFVFGADKNQENRRFRKNLAVKFIYNTDESEEYFKGFNLRTNLIINIIGEIIKNSLDHTEGKVYFGINYVINKDRSLLRLSFVVADEGTGIHESIKSITGKKDLSYEEAHKIASTSGWTSIGGDTNMGAGIFETGNRTRFANKIPGVKINLRMFDNGRTGVIYDAGLEVQDMFEVNPEIRFYHKGEVELMIQSKD